MGVNNWKLLLEVEAVTIGIKHAWEQDLSLMSCRIDSCEKGETPLLFKIPEWRPQWLVEKIMPDGFVNAQITSEQTIEGWRWPRRQRTKSAGKEGNEVEDKAKQKEQPPPSTKPLSVLIFPLILLALQVLPCYFHFKNGTRAEYGYEGFFPK